MERKTGRQEKTERLGCAKVVLRALKDFLGSFIGSRQIKKLLLLYTILFLITFFLACSPFLVEGKSLIWSSSDGHTQHYPALAYTGRYLRRVILNLLHGEIGVPLYDFSLGMGGDVIATLNYYGFGDPLHLLSALIPTHYTEALFNFLVMFRLYLAGLSFCYLCTYHKKPPSHAIVGALIYVFSGYMTYSAFAHPCFLNPMIHLPLLLVGIDMVIQRRKPFVFILSVFYAALCGFYFLYIMTILLGIYVVARFWDCYEQRRVKEFLCMTGRIAGTYTLGIGLSAPIFLPAVMGFLSSARTSGATIERNYLSYGWKYYRNSFFKLVAPPGSWVALTVAAMAFFALILLLRKKKGHRTLKLLLVSCTVLYVLPFGGYMMNGFSYPVQRWTFGVALLLAYITVEMLPTLLDMGIGQQLFCFGATVLYATLVFLCPSVRNIYHVVGVAMLAITLAVLLLEKNLFQEHQNHMLAMALCLSLVIGNVGVNVLFKLSKDQGGGIYQHREYGVETEQLETAIERDAEPYLESAEGRFDSSSFSLNVGAVWRVPNMYTYWSILNRYISQFGSKTEDAARRYTNYVIYGVHERTGIGTLFSTKYFIDQKNKSQYVPFGYSLVEETNRGNLIYENRYALPWGYTYDSYVIDDNMEGQNGLDIAETMLQHIILEDDIQGLPIGVVENEIQPLGYQVKESNDVIWENGVLIVNKNNAVMTLEFEMPPETEGYMRLQGLRLSETGVETTTLTVTCNDVKKVMSATSPAYTWYNGREDYLINLGYCDNRRSVCTIVFPNKGTYELDDIQLFALSMERYPERVEALRAEPLENIEFGINRVAGTVDLSNSKILCISIPYSSGWTAKVDGQKAGILRGNYMFMALPLAEGHHEIEFSYCSPGLKTGIVAFLLSANVVIYLTYQHRRKRRA